MAAVLREQDKTKTQFLFLGSAGTSDIYGKIIIQHVCSGGKYKCVEIFKGGQTSVVMRGLDAHRP
jgi:hypothetical protein